MYTQGRSAFIRWSALEPFRRDAELSQLVVQRLPRDAERGGRGGKVRPVPAELLGNDRALEVLHLLRQTMRQPGLLRSAAHLGQPVAEQPEHEAVRHVAQL